MSDIKLPPPVGHAHSNGEYCAESRILSNEWPVSLYTAGQVRAAVEADRAGLIAEVERFATEMDEDGRPSGAVIRLNLLPRLRALATSEAGAAQPGERKEGGDHG